MQNKNRFSADRKTIRALARKDDRALDQLFRTYYPSLCFFAFQQIERLDTAEEIAGNAFVTLWTERRKISKHTNLRHYLYGHVWTACNDWRHQQAESQASHTLHDLVVKPESVRYIHEILNQLPPISRLAFHLHYLGGHNFSETARKLHLQTAAVVDRLKMVRKTILETFIPG